MKRRKQNNKKRNHLHTIQTFDYTLRTETTWNSENSLKFLYNKTRDRKWCTHVNIQVYRNFRISDHALYITYTISETKVRKKFPPTDSVACYSLESSLKISGETSSRTAIPFSTDLLSIGAKARIGREWTQWGGSSFTEIDR